MKPRNPHRFLALAGSTLIFAGLAPTAHSAALTWDADSGATGAQDGGGTWATAAGNWRNVTTSTDNVNWVNANNDSATFGAGTDGTYAITLSGTVQAAGGVTFNNSGYTLSGSSLSLVNGSANAGITVAAGKTATINSTLRYNHNVGANVTVSTGGVLNLGGGTTASFNPQFAFSGAGAVNLTGGTFTQNIGSINSAAFNLTAGTHAITPGNNNGATIGATAGRNVNYTVSGTGTLTVNNNAASGTGTAPSFLRIGNATTSAFEAKLTVQTGGTVTIGSGKAGELQIAGSADSNGKLDVQGGTVTIAAGVPAANQIYLFKAGAAAGYAATMTQSGGTVTANGIQFGGTSGTYDTTSSATLTLSGGSLYIGAQGMTRGSAATDLPITIQLQGGTLGADQNWTSSLDMKLGTTGGGPVIQAQNSASTSRNITLSGNLSNDGAVNGTLTKSGGGDLSLSGTNTYSGGTIITAGRLIIAGANALPTTGAVQVGNGGDDRLIFNVGGSPTFNQSITLANGAALVMRQAATLTNVILPTAGTVVFNKDNAATVGFTLNSDVALSGDLTIDVGGGSTAPTQAVTLAGDFSGGFGLIKEQVGELVISGTNTYSGNTLVNNGTLTLADGGGLTFTIAASGVNNQISGDATPGTVSLDGIFTFDLTAAGTALGDFWNIVDYANLGSVTFGSNFEVADFTNAGGGLWNRNFGGADYQFDTTSGLLTVIPEPSAALLGGLGLLALLRRRRVG